MKTKTQKEIEAELKLLREYAPKIPQCSAFGDDNRASIDAAIEALEENMEEKDVFKKGDEEEWDHNEVDSARSAIEWRDEGGGSVSEGWEGLVKSEGRI